MFSSPSGDGLVRIVAGSMEQSSFSSPLGDGLVLDYSYNQRDCKPYSSPSGDGLVLQILTEILKNQVIRYRHNKQLQTDR